MIEAWLSASEMTASCSSRMVSNRPPLASKHDEYRIVSSVPRNGRQPALRAHLCTVWVPQMNRTDAIP